VYWVPPVHRVLTVVRNATLSWPLLVLVASLWKRVTHWSLGGANGTANGQNHEVVQLQRCWPCLRWLI